MGLVFAECESFAKEDTGRIDHHAQDALRFKISDKLSIKHLRHVIAGTVFQTNVGQPQRHLSGNSCSQVEHGEGVATGRLDGTSPEFNVAGLKRQTTDTYVKIRY